MKNARVISEHAAKALPAGATPPDVFAAIPMDVLSSLHQSDNPANLIADPQLKSLVSGIVFPAISDRAAAPLFNSSLHFVQITFTVQNQQNAKITVSNADMQTIVTYALAVSGAINAYASQYGPASLTVSPDIIQFAVVLPTNQYNDSNLQQWVNQIAVNLPPGAAVAVPNPLGVVNTNHTLSNGVYGYHYFGGFPYLMVNLRGTGLTVADKKQYYATNLSHEMAEMTVDPKADGRNPEVCDPCGPNYRSTVIDFFKIDGTYLGSETYPTQPSYPFDLQLNAVVRPRSSTPSAAPDSDCAYPPRGRLTSVATADNLWLFWRGPDGAVWHLFSNPNEIWSSEQSLGGKLNGDPIAATVPGTNDIQLFYRGTDNAIWSRTRDFTSGNWSGEQRIGGKLLGDPMPAVIPGTNILQLFYRGTDNAIFSRWRNTDGSWSNEQRIGGALNGDPIAAVIPGTDVLQLFYRGLDNSIWSRWRNTDGTWSPDEQPLGGGGLLLGDPIAAVLPGTDVLQLFYRVQTFILGNAIFSRWRNTDGTWSDQQDIGGKLNGDPVAAVLPGTDVLQLFYRGLDNAVWSRWRNTDGTWSNEQSIGGALNGDPIAAALPDIGVFWLVYRGLDDSILARTRDPRSGTWSGEQKIGQ
jgi:hypothetical protein